MRPVASLAITTASRTRLNSTPTPSCASSGDGAVFGPQPTLSGASTIHIESRAPGEARHPGDPRYFRFSGYGQTSWSSYERRTKCVRKTVHFGTQVAQLVCV